MSRLAALRRRFAGQAGTTVLEIAITMVMLSMIGVLIMNSISTAEKATAHVDDQSRGLADLQVVSERMSRDLRAARGVDPLASTSQLTLWIDSDSDYKRDQEESVTWRIRCRSGLDCGSDERQYDVERVVGPVATGSVTIVGQSLVSDIAFAYLLDGVVHDPVAADSCVDAGECDAVKVSMEYDAIVDAFAKTNTVDFEVRLRNVE